MYRLHLKNFLIIAFLFVIVILPENICASIIINCNVTSEDNPFMSAALSVSDSLDNKVYSATVNEPNFNFQVTDRGLYKISLLPLGFNEWSQNIHIDGDTTININLTPNTKILQEVTVQADRSSKTTATGEIFKLSAKAKASGDPYIALSEIPVLDVNVPMQKVTTQDGTSPLILIDGKYLNSGINPIDPKFIESVEVVEVTNAKYIEMGVSKILNIKLKRDVPFYSYVEARTRHDIPIDYGLAGANFEFGSPKFAVAGNIFGHYRHHSKTAFNSEEMLGDNFKTKNGENVLNEFMWEGYILLKWTPNKSNYFSARLGTTDTHGKTSGVSSGKYNSLYSNNLSSSTHSHTIDGGTAASAFYEHTFANKDRLSAFGYYNRGFYDNEESNSETISNEESEPETDFYYEYSKSMRDQYSISVDYDSSTHAFGSISAGAKYTYTKDRQKNLASDPIEFSKLIWQNSYAYFSYSYNWKKLLMMASAGIQYMDISTSAATNNWWRPRASASITLLLPKKQNLRLSYILNNSIPPATYLQTFNTSVDPWVRIEGNPYLKPMRINSFRLNYIKNIKRSRINFYASYRLNKDMFDSYIRNEDGVSIHTYRNYGSYHNWTLGGSAAVAIRNVTLRPYASWSSEQYEGFGSRPYVSLGGSVRWDFGKFFFYTSVDWKTRSYSPYSYTRYKSPTSSLIQLTWRPTRPVQITLGMYNYIGVKRQETITRKENYYKMTDLRYKGNSLHPFILVSWTIRKNAKYAIKNKMPNI